MHAQRVRVGESRIGKQIAKWTAEGTVKGFGRVFCDVGAYVSCREYEGISQKCMGHSMKQGGTAGIVARPWKALFMSSGTGFLYYEKSS